jgi:cell division protease FtsH
MFWHKFKLLFQRYWLWIALVIVVILSTVLPFWFLGTMDEATRRYIIGIHIVALPFGLIQTALFVVALYFLQYGGFTQMKKTKIDGREVDIRFSDVIGLSEAKREAWEVVQLIRDRKRLKKIGGKIVRGLLMVGPPGCGKTLLAKAIATEAGVPFLSAAGSEFVEVFVGVGAARVRKLFKQARQYADAYGACIIFIDEVEVIGRTRILYDAFGGGAETNSTQNQLLVEMDGLNEKESNVIVIAATNAAEQILDPALLRPGRFDRQITISRPNLDDRKELFEYYLRKIKWDPAVDVARLARKAVYKTPAEIENIVKESALIATRNDRDTVSYKDISEAIERIELGVAHRLNMTPREREMTAMHEAGHLIVLYLTHPTRDVFKASIIQRGGVLGVVHSTPKDEMYSSDRRTLEAHVRVALAGYAAEKLRYNTTTDGVSADFANAMNYAHTMVWRYGMGSEGFVGDYTAIPKDQISDAMKDRLNKQTELVLRNSLREVEAILRAESTLLDRFASELLKRDELDYDDIASIFREYGKPPNLGLAEGGGLHMPETLNPELNKEPPERQEPPAGLS